MNIDWSKAPEGATHAGNSPYEKGVVTWFKGISDPASRNHFMNAGSMNAWAISSENLSAWDLIERPKKQDAWVKGELPPIGFICEYQTWINREWKKTKILAHHLGFAVHSWSIDGDDLEVDAAPPQDFRPIKTAEQLAEEEIQAIRDEIRWQKPQLGPCPVAQLYNKGYRKQ